MGLLFVFMLVTQGDNRVELRHTDIPPRLDGSIEELWLAADTVDRFFQSWPQEGELATERTELYLLQDAGHLYVGVRGWCEHGPPVGQLYGLEDEITLLIDPMDSKSMGYFFKVYGSGLHHDGLVLDNGAEWDWSWEGVWDCAARLYDDRIEVEMAIPFKSIRYKEGADEWGFDLERFISREQERDHIFEVREQEGGYQVSKFARLTGVDPQAHGYYFELFPEGFVRYDEAPGEDSRVRPRASLNLKWDLTSQTTMNATVLPDFAQIESDPYSFNLSRYPVYFSELRPFFVEGSELFRMTSLGQGIFSPLQLFYSRRIGKAVGEEPVPILSGLKLTTRSRDWSLGALGAYTDRLTDTAGTELEARRGFAVLSGRAGLPDDSRLGMMFAGTAVDGDDYNYAVGSDWSFCDGPHRGTVQAAYSDYAGTPGWALNSGYTGFIGNFATFGVLEAISDSFSVEDIGYVPWAGQKRLSFGSGPMVRGTGREFRQLWLVPGVYGYMEPGSNEMSYGGSVYTDVDFRNWGVEFNVEGGRKFEADTSFFSRFVHLSYWGNSLKHNLNFGGTYQHGYNYLRGYVAPRFSDWLTFTYYAAGRVALMLSGNNWWEFSPEGDVVQVTSVARPKIDFRINARVSFNVYSELVAATPETRFGETEILTNRVGFLFSWNFRPKSWLFVAFNDYRADYSPFEGDGNALDLENRVGAVKLRYLLYI